MAKKFKCNVCGQTFEAEQMPDKCPICGAPASEIEEVVEAGASAGKPKKKGLDTNSNVYTIVYAIVMVAIVAFLLAFVSSTLKPAQDANVLRDTKNQILLSLNIEGLKGDAVDAKYAEVITDTAECDGNEFYIASVDGVNKFVLPVKGRGLWGGLWGYISVNDDMNTVFGTYFSHESETAGLGARINERWFQQQFCGKPIHGEDGQIALTVVKAGAASAETEVDGVTGATLTSKGVAGMVNDGLSKFASLLSQVDGEGDCCAKAEGECCGKCQGEGQCEADAACPMEGECQQAEDCAQCPNANVEQN